MNNNTKKSNRNFILFWVISAIFLTGWYFFWQAKTAGIGSILKSASGFLDLIPMNSEKREKLKAVGYFADYLSEENDQEKTFLLLFQNNMELRPGGGYIGSFGILKVKNGKVTMLQTHDLSNFDGRVPDGIEPPYPMKQTLNISSWKMRDSNWSPDFPTNAKKAEEFYLLGKGEEKFDGIVAIDTNILTSFLKITGPVEIEGYPGTYDSENAVLNLEYQVEQGSYKQGEKRGDRKSVMGPLADAIIQKAMSFDSSKKIELAELILEDLNAKSIQLYFKNPELQSHAEASGWGGVIDQKWNNDYLAMIDANLGSLKSDYYMKRSFEYRVDFTGETPKAQLKITYNHTAKEKNWMTSDYLTYLRVYTPHESWLTDTKNIGDKKFGDDLGKKYFGTLVSVKLGQSKTVELDYNLPKDMTSEDYNLLIQKQSGVSDIPGKVMIIEKNGKEVVLNIKLAGDWKYRN
jgi:hypothetical protein